MSKQAMMSEKRAHGFWKSPAGFEAAVQKLESHGFILNQPWNCMSYWTKNFRNVTHTKFVVSCCTCQYTNDRISICNLMKVKPGCFCTGSLRWSDPASRRALNTIVSTSRFSWSDCALDDLWWKANITGESSIMPVCCDVCGLATTASIHNFRRRGGSSAGCGCGNQRMSVELLEQRVASHGWSIVSGAQEATMTSTVIICCNKCGFVAPSTCHYLAGSSPSCICTGKVFWSNTQMRLPFVEIVKSTRFKVPIFAETDDQWTKKRILVRKTIIELECGECGHLSSGKFVNFLAYHSFPCACSRFQTEAIFYAALRQMVGQNGHLKVEIQVRVDYKSGGRGFIDAVVYLNGVPIVAFELDGEQHFRSVDSLTPHSFAIQQQRDRNKENHCSNVNLPLVRFYQPDVFKRCIPWEQMMQDALNRAYSSTLNRVTYHSRDGMYVCVCKGRNRCAWCGLVGV